MADRPPSKTTLPPSIRLKPTPGTLSSRIPISTNDAGTYQVQLLAGPNLTPVDAAANLDLTAPAGGTGGSSP